jgi:hypothetical protein
MDKNQLLRQLVTDLHQQLDSDSRIVLPTNVILIAEGIDDEGESSLMVMSTDQTIWNMLGLLELLAEDLRSKQVFG